MSLNQLIAFLYNLENKKLLSNTIQSFWIELRTETVEIFSLFDKKVKFKNSEIQFKNFPNITDSLRQRFWGISGGNWAVALPLAPGFNLLTANLIGKEFLRQSFPELLDVDCTKNYSNMRSKLQYATLLKTSYSRCRLFV